jgi:hypothetical protein
MKFLLQILPCFMTLWIAVSGFPGRPALGQAETSRRFLDNGQVRIGIDLTLGGAITYLSKSGSDVNLVNSADWGRQIQMSFYSGPTPFIPRGKRPAKAWEGLGWNPIQSGDSFGHQAHVIESRSDGKELYVKSIPMQWPLDNEPGECTFETWIRLEGSTAQVHSRIVNHRADMTQYSGRDQELPAIYTNGPWYRLMTYIGDKPFTGDALTQIPAQFPWSGWAGTENWAALVNDQDWGVGIWEPGVYAFIGGFAGKPGAGGTHDGPTGYIAPLHREILDHNITYEYRYVLILGSLTEIRRYVTTHTPKSAPPDDVFTSDRRHWRYVDAVDTGWPIRGELQIKPTGPNPQMIGPDGFWQARAAPTLSLLAAFPRGQQRASVFWKRRDSPDFRARQSMTFDLNPDGAYHRYQVPLAASPEYNGIITGLRLDLETNGMLGVPLRLKSIGFPKATFR